MRSQSRIGWLLSIVAIGMCSATLLGAAGQVAPAGAGPAQPKNAGGPATAGDEVFAANCARCHTPPMTLNPRVTGTILRHMRVKARLSRSDEQLLLKFLAP
jgi:cytochrome c5